MTGLAFVEETNVYRTNNRRGSDREGNAERQAQPFSQKFPAIIAVAGFMACGDMDHFNWWWVAIESVFNEISFRNFKLQIDICL